jgi:AbrB family looped-hinge helix DNA binding protein
MTHRVGPKGQVVIPKDLRDALGIEPGDDISFWREGDHVALRPVRSSVSLKGRFAGVDLVSALLAERREDEVRETRR